MASDLPPQNTKPPMPLPSTYQNNCPRVPLPSDGQFTAVVDFLSTTPIARPLCFLASPLASLRDRLNPAQAIDRAQAREEEEEEILTEQQLEDWESVEGGSGERSARQDTRGGETGEGSNVFELQSIYGGERDRSSIASTLGATGNGSIARLNQNLAIATTNAWRNEYISEQRGEVGTSRKDRQSNSSISRTSHKSATTNIETVQQHSEQDFRDQSALRRQTTIKKDHENEPGNEQSSSPRLRTSSRNTTTNIDTTQLRSEQQFRDHSAQPSNTSQENEPKTEDGVSPSFYSRTTTLSTMFPPTKVRPFPQEQDRVINDVDTALATNSFRPWKSFQHPREKDGDRTTIKDRSSPEYQAPLNEEESVRKAEIMEMWKNKAERVAIKRRQIALQGGYRDDDEGFLTSSDMFEPTLNSSAEMGGKVPGREDGIAAVENDMEDSDFFDVKEFLSPLVISRRWKKPLRKQPGMKTNKDMTPEDSDEDIEQNLQPGVSKTTNTMKKTTTTTREKWTGTTTQGQGTTRSRQLPVLEEDSDEESITTSTLRKAGPRVRRQSNFISYSNDDEEPLTFL